MLPHLASARTALDEAGITVGPTPGVATPQPVAAAPASEPAPAESAPAEEVPTEEAPAEEPEAAPARRSIASLVGDDEGDGDEATH